MPDYLALDEQLHRHQARTISCFRMSNEERSQFPSRPPRLKTIFTGARPFYFITFNTRNRSPLLANAEVHGEFEGFTRNGIRKGIAVGNYVIMPDHIHLFVVMPPTGTSLGRWVGSLKSALGRILDRRSHPKPHWQEGFFDHLLRTSDSYSQKWEYVRMNPVRKDLCTGPDDWPYQGQIASLRF